MVERAISAAHSLLETTSPTLSSPTVTPPVTYVPSGKSKHQAIKEAIQDLSSTFFVGTSGKCMYILWKACLLISPKY